MSNGVERCKSLLKGVVVIVIVVVVVVVVVVIMLILATLVLVLFFVLFPAQPGLIRCPSPEQLNNCARARA